MIEIIAILVLSGICIAQMVDKHLFAEKMFKQLDDTVKAIKSKDLNEYISAKSQDEIKKEPFLKQDEVFLEDASDEEFNKHIKTQN